MKISNSTVSAFILGLATSLAAFAQTTPHEQAASKIEHTEDGQSHSEFELKKTYWSVTMNRKDQIKLTNLKQEPMLITLDLTVGVDCKVSEAKAGFAPGSYVGNWDISETFCTKTEAPIEGLQFETPEEPGYITDEQLVEEFAATVKKALDKQNIAAGTGLNYNTNAARMMEMMVPGIQQAFTEKLTDVAFRDRKDEIAHEVATLIVTSWHAGLFQQN